MSITRFPNLERVTRKPVGHVLASVCLTTCVFRFSVGTLGIYTGLLYFAVLCGVALLFTNPPEIRSVGIFGGPFLLLLWWLIATNLWTINTIASADSLRTMFLYTFCGWSAARVLRPDELHRTLFDAAFGTILVAALDVVVNYSAATVSGADGAPGWHALFTHKNELGFFCVIALVIFWTYPVSGRRRWFSIGLAAVLLIKSHSSTSFAATFVVAGMVLLERSLRHRRTERARLLLLSTAFLALLLSLANLANVGTVARLLGRDPTLSGRNKIWAPVWDKILLRPMTGYGWGAVWTGTNPIRQYIIDRAQFSPAHAHNMYLDLLLQIGLPGLVLYVVVLGRIAIAASGRSTLSAGISRLATLSVVVVAVTGLSESLVLRETGWFIVVLMSYEVGLRRNSSRVEGTRHGQGARYISSPVPLGSASMAVARPNARPSNPARLKHQLAYLLGLGCSGDRLEDLLT